MFETRFLFVVRTVLLLRTYVSGQTKQSLRNVYRRHLASRNSADSGRANYTTAVQMLRRSLRRS